MRLRRTYRTPIEHGWRANAAIGHICPHAPERVEMAKSKAACKTCD